MQDTDERVAAGLRSAGLHVSAHGALLLREPAEVAVDMARWAGHFGTLMPFYRACQKLGAVGIPQPVPARLAVEREDQGSK